MESVEQLLESSFSPKVCGLLRRIGAKAQALGMKAYIVGGAVRDILKGESNFDLDISVEGDAEVFVQNWNEPGCRGVVHGRYKTGTITFPDKQKVDIATARREFYEYAAAIPEVSSDSLKQDLARRDFSVNAMAVSLSEGDWGTLIDFHGGRRDLKEGILRVLHNLSFVEDPSRVLRGVRLEQRLGMKFEDNTLRLVRNTIKGGLLGKLSNARVRAEVEINCKDRVPQKIAVRMQELGIWEALFPGLRFGPIAVKKLEYLRKILFLTKKSGTSFKDQEWLAYIVIIFSEVSASVRLAAMDRLNFTSQERGILTACFASLQPIEQFFGPRKMFKNSEVYLYLKQYEPVPLLYCMAATKRRSIRRWVALHMFSFVPLKGELTGKELLAMGCSSGPWMGEILEGIRLGRMDGKYKTRDDELWYVKENLMRD
jgi:tRNA nucleotidyltransferase (CCA-adding enzyme)